MQCPTCKSDNLCVKTPGWPGKPEENPAAARCLDCEWSGTIGDVIKARVIDCAVKLVETFRDANDIGEALSQLSEAVDALGYKGNYKEIE